MSQLTHLKEIGRNEGEIREMMIEEIAKAKKWGVTRKTLVHKATWKLERMYEVIIKQKALNNNKIEA